MAARAIHDASFAGDDGTPIVAYAWTPDGPPRGVVQIAHGMGEHALRYARLAGALTAAGFAVYANDHRGHGRTAPATGGLGALGPGGFPGVVADMATFSRRLRAAHPGVPLVLLGHSMGSFAAQAYILDHAVLIDALALSGSAALDLAWPELGAQAAKGLSFNAGFTPARTDFDWLSRDQDEVDRYVADPMCGFNLEPESMASFVETCLGAADPARIAGIARRLPIYVLAGARDPVTGDLAWLTPLVDRYAAAGQGPIATDFHPDGRHEMFNETNRDEVTRRLVSWLHERVCAA
jgi:alpha-beta hydrolase superfamily lysophospholipase